jgi:hypothetical protein
MKVNQRFQNYINEKNYWNRITNASAVVTFPLSQGNVDYLAERLGSDLSPENLHCDGEISFSKARARGRKLGGIVKDLTAYAKANKLNPPVIYY